ncbi:MAG: RBBP9/YdeN family alpha/beta hydrolase [Bosea sp. (in: a-proteobacteria)]
MRTSEADILFIPGWSGSGPDHWQTRWARKLSTGRLVEQPDWYKPDREVWAANIVAAVRASTRPVVLVAHSAGCGSVAHAAEMLEPGEVRGALLVAPAAERALHAIPGLPADFAKHRRVKLPFHSVVIGSSTDPYCTVDEAQELAGAWGATFSDAGDAGHLNTESGHGPWPEGLMRLAGFLRTLSAA